jgi:hypothetical protein
MRRETRDLKDEGEIMTRVLFSATTRTPSIFPTCTAARHDGEKVRVGIEVAMKQFALRGWEADLCLLGRETAHRQ